MSNSIHPLYADFKILSSYRSDHSTITLKLHIQKSPKGAGFWKKIILTEDLNQAIKNEIMLIVRTYACTPYHPDFVKSYQIGDTDIMINIKLFWDILHTQIRGLLISYAGKKKREQNVEENLLNKKIELLEEEFSLNAEDIETFNNLKETKNKLQEIREIKLKGALITR